MWTSDDAAALSDFLNKNPKFLMELATRTPSIETKTVEGTAMSGARHAGAEQIIKSILDMREAGTIERLTDFITAKDQ